MKRADVLLKPLIHDLGINDGIRLAQIRSHWRTLFQKPLVYHMSPAMLSGGELLLNVDSPVWLQELKFHQTEIIDKLTRYQVKTVRFRLGRINAPANRPAAEIPSKGKPLTDRDRAFIEETVAPIGDEGLKEVVKRAIAKAMQTGRLY